MAATRRPPALAAAVATAAALGATFALPAIAADGSAAKVPAAVGAPAPVFALESGSLDWGFKASFREMIEGAEGTTTLAGGVTRNADGTYEFPLDKGGYDGGNHGVTSSFKGSVHYVARDGALDIELSDVKVRTAGKSGTITVDITAKSPGKDAVVTEDVALSTLDLDGVTPSEGADGRKYADIPGALTEEGAAVFAGYYSKGDPVDPATLTVKQAERPVDQPVDPPVKPPVEPPVKPSVERPVKPAKDPAVTETAKPVSGPLVDGTLDWGLKKSFRAYVVGPIAHGKVETSEGATANADGYRFTKATGDLDADKNTLNAQFKGKVRFLGHETGGAYELDLSLSNLKVDIAGTTGKLVADVTTKARPTAENPKPEASTLTGLAFADLKVPAGALTAKDGVVNLKGIPATLTEDGSKAFSGMYEKGEELDALTAAVSLDKDATLPPGGSTEYENCAAAEAAGVTPIKKGEPGYAVHLDGDGDGVACESGESGGSTGGSTTGGSTIGGGTVGGSTTGGSTTGGSTTGGSVGGSGALASTGSDVPTGALTGASGLVVGAGAGIVIAARRRRDAGA
ncbi:MULTISPECIES: HtaA domain-containing protein [unclassified Streptomyces]|uniref:HtaA domain-containing protein n=1 Tax=unclassified Streptomyces TaxID=2593676 RepID=UPI00344D2F04